MSVRNSLPNRIEDEEQLEDLLTTPTTELIEFIKTIPSPLIVFGAGGKMGPTLARLAKRAAEASKHQLEVVAISRFSQPELVGRLNLNGVKTLSCDLLQRNEVQRLPDASNILYLVGLKFGTSQKPAATWAINTIVPTHVAERYRDARIVALSTGNVYPLSDSTLGGSRESDPLIPLGEYANAAVARERLFEFHSCANGTPIALLRLFYAVELRYGVLVDIARKVHGGESIDLANGYFNCIWQGDANDMALRALSLTSSPPSSWNLCRPETFSVRAVAKVFAQLFGREAKFTGQEAANALLGNSGALCSRLGAPAVGLDAMTKWIAAWIERGGRDLGKPTHFESRDGRY